MGAGLPGVEGSAAVNHEEETQNFIGLPDGDDYYDDIDSLDCTYCGGDGDVENDDPLWYDGDYRTCPSCNGSGKRKDMTLW